MNMFAKGAAFLTSKQREYTSSPVTYQSGADQWDEVPAVLAMISEDQLDSFPEEVSVTKLRDFLIIAADVDKHQPRMGDKVIYASGTYEVVRDITGATFGWTEPQRIRMRIHTQYMGELT